MPYRTKTYIAGDWTGDKDLIDQLYSWNSGDYWSLNFTDAHELTQSRDTSLYCTIKSSLNDRLNASKTFVLVVGEQTKNLTKGGCQYCGSYNSWTKWCARSRCIDYRSYIEYECEKAKNDRLKIVVIYNSYVIEKEKCPAILCDIGRHVKGLRLGKDWKFYWNYLEIKDAIMS